MTDNHITTTRSITKIWTGIQHSFGLITVLGLFVTISSYSTDPDSGVVLIGLIVTIFGLIGFIVGLIEVRRYNSQENKGNCP